MRSIPIPPPRPRAWLRLAALAGSAVALLALVATAAPQGGAWLQVSTPGERETRESSIPLVEVRGRAGVGVPGRHDVVLLIDRSVSTFTSSGVDVNANGRIGRDVSGRLPPVLRTTDFGDTVIQAEVEAARRLIDRLDPATTRMGLVTFGGTSHVRAAVGSDRETLREALDGLGTAPNQDGTYLYGALLHALDALEAAPAEEGVPRSRFVILLSDGVPTAPHPPETAYKATLRAARRAAAQDVLIHAFALGEPAAAERVVFDEMVEANGGQLSVLRTPGDVLWFVPHLSLSHVDRLEVDNLSMSLPARALRVFPDGSFDAFAPLRPGENRLRFRVVTDTGLERVVDRVVRFVPRSADAPGEADARARLLRTLEIRTIETRLAEEAREQRRRVLERSLEVEVEPEVPAR